MTDDELLRICRHTLRGVGDATLGEWAEVSHKPDSTVVHLRRRTTDAEAKVIGPLRDIRNTQEARIRIASLLPCIRRDMFQYVSPEW